MSAPTVRVLPLGGLGEIGKNMTVVEQDGRIVVIDVGLRFPTQEQHGVDLVAPRLLVPDRPRRSDRGDRDHARHEDHLGSLPFLLRQLTPHRPKILARAAHHRDGALQARRAQDQGCDAQAHRAGERIQAGPFSIELVHMTHSIPDACGVIVETAHARSSSPATTSLIRRPSTAHPEISAAWLSSDATASCCSAAIRRMPIVPAGRSLRPSLARACRSSCALRGPDPGHLLCLQHPPRAAGDRRGRQPQPQGVPDRALHAQEHGDRALTWPHRRALTACS